MNYEQVKLRQDIYACLNKANSLIRDYADEARVGALPSKLKMDIHACLNRLTVLIRDYAYEAGIKDSARRCRDAVKTIAYEIGTTPEAIRVRSHCEHIVIKRQICQYVMREALAASYPEIGKATGVAHHTTIMHSCRKIERWREANPEFDKKIRHLCGLFLDRPQAQEEIA